MGRGEARPRRRPVPEGAADDQLGEFLERVRVVEDENPGEPDRWVAFFARLRVLLSVAEGRDA